MSKRIDEDINMMIKKVGGVPMGGTTVRVLFGRSSILPLVAVEPAQRGQPVTRGQTC